MTNQNLLQMSLGSKQNPMNIILGGNDKGIQLCFNSKGNKKRKNFSYVNKKNWIPPPAKSSRIAKHNCLKVPGNDIMLTLPDDGQFLLPYGLPLVIESRNLENFKAAFYPSPQISENGVQSFRAVSEDLLDDYAKRIKDSHDIQHAVVKESEKLLKEQESKRFSISKQIRSLRRNLEEIGKAVKGIEKCQTVLDRENKRIQLHHCICNKYIQRRRQDESSTTKSDKSTQEMEDFEQVYRQEDSTRHSQDDPRTVPKTFIRPKEINIPPDQVFRKLKQKENLQKMEKQNLDPPIQIPDNVEAETTMMKLADNMRKSKQLVDGILVQEEIVDELQNSYIQNVEALYEDQQKIINDMIQAYGSGIISSEEGELENSPDSQLKDDEKKNVGFETYEHANDELKEFRTCHAAKYKVNSLPNIARVLRNQSMAEKLALANFQAQKLRKEVELLKSKETSKTKSRSDRNNANQVQQIAEEDSEIVTVATDSETDAESQFKEIIGTIVHKYNILKGCGYQGNVYETTITQEVKDLPTVAEGTKPEFAELSEEERLASLYDAQNAMKKLEETIEKLVKVIPKVNQQIRGESETPIAVSHYEENISANILKNQEIRRDVRHDYEKASTTQKVARDSQTQVNRTGEMFMQEVGHTAEANVQGVRHQRGKDIQETSRQREADAQEIIRRSEYNGQQKASFKTPVIVKGKEQHADSKLVLSYDSPKQESELQDSKKDKRVSKTERSSRTSSIPKRSISDRPIKLTSKGSSGFEVTGSDALSSKPPHENQRMLSQKATVFENSQRKEGPVIPSLVGGIEATQQIHDSKLKITPDENVTESLQQGKRQFTSTSIIRKEENSQIPDKISQNAENENINKKTKQREKQIISPLTSNDENIKQIQDTGNKTVQDTNVTKKSKEKERQIISTSDIRKDDEMAHEPLYFPEEVSKNILESTRISQNGAMDQKYTQRNRVSPQVDSTHLEDEVIERTIDSSCELETPQQSDPAISREHPQKDRSSLTRFHVPEMISENYSKFSSKKIPSEEDKILEESILSEYEVETSQQPNQVTSRERSRKRHKTDAKEKGIYSPEEPLLTKFHMENDEIIEGSIDSSYELVTSQQQSDQAIPGEHLQKDRSSRFHAPEMVCKNDSKFPSEERLSDQDEIIEESIPSEYELETSQQPDQTISRELSRKLYNADAFEGLSSDDAQPIQETIRSISNYEVESSKLSDQTTSNEQSQPYFNHDVHTGSTSDDTDEIEDETISNISDYELVKSDESGHSTPSNNFHPRFHLNEDVGSTVYTADKYRNGYINLKPKQISAMPSGLQGQRLPIYNKNGTPVYGARRMTFMNNGTYGKYQDRVSPSSENYRRGTRVELALGSINRHKNHVTNSKYQNNYVDESRFNKHRLRAGSIPVSYQYGNQEFASIKPRDRAMTFHGFVSPRKENGIENEKTVFPQFNCWKSGKYMLPSDIEQSTIEPYNPYITSSQLRDGRRSTEPEVAIAPKSPNWHDEEMRRRHTFYTNEEDKQRKKIKKLYEEIMS